MIEVGQFVKLWFLDHVCDSTWHKLTSQEPKMLFLAGVVTHIGDGYINVTQVTGWTESGEIDSDDDVGNEWSVITSTIRHYLTEDPSKWEPKAWQGEASES